MPLAGPSPVVVKPEVSVERNSTHLRHRAEGWISVLPKNLGKAGMVQSWPFKGRSGEHGACFLQWRLREDSPG